MSKNRRITTVLGSITIILLLFNSVIFLRSNGSDYQVSFYFERLNIENYVDFENEITKLLSSDSSNIMVSSDNAVDIDVAGNIVELKINIFLKDSSKEYQVEKNGEEYYLTYIGTIDASFNESFTLNDCLTGIASIETTDNIRVKFSWDIIYKTSTISIDDQFIFVDDQYVHIEEEEIGAFIMFHVYEFENENLVSNQRDVYYYFVGI